MFLKNLNPVRRIRELTEELGRTRRERDQARKESERLQKESEQLQEEKQQLQEEKQRLEDEIKRLRKELEAKALKMPFRRYLQADAYLENLRGEITESVVEAIGRIARPDKIQFVTGWSYWLSDGFAIAYQSILPGTSFERQWHLLTATPTGEPRPGSSMLGSVSRL